MSTYIEVGENVPIWAQLVDGEESLPKYVRAEIYNPAGTLLGTRDLVHIDCGYFENKSFIMPLIDYVRVQIKVYDDPAYSVLSERYSFAQDFFYNADQIGGGGGSGVDDDCTEILFEFEDQDEIALEFEDLAEISLELSDNSQEIDFDVESEGNVELLFEDSDSEIEILFECYCEGA